MQHVIHAVEAIGIVALLAVAFGLVNEIVAVGAFAIFTALLVRNAASRV